MKKLVGIVALSLTFSLSAQDVQDEAVMLEQEMSDESAFIQEEPAPAPVPVIIAKVEEPAPVAVKLEEKKEEKKSEYPKIKQSGAVSFTPRMEILGSNDASGDKIDNPAANQRRLMLGWSYKLSVAVNEKLDLNFRLSEPSAEAGTAIAGSGSNLKNMIAVYLPNAYFTWKAAKVFHLSGGLLNIANNTALDLETNWSEKDPSKVYGNQYFNSLAGLDFAFPVTPSAKIFLTAGIVDNTNWNKLEIAGADTVKPYSDGRIMVGADLSLAEKKVSLRPLISVKTRGDLKINDSTINSDRKPVIAEGIDMSFKIATPFSLNANIGAVQDNLGDDKERYNLIGAGVEPVFTFGGENSKLFTIRAKYAFDISSNGADSAVSKDNDKKSFTNHIDARFAIAVNEKMSIVPRLRYWQNNGAGWYERTTKAYVDNDERSKSLARYEIAFIASF
ncbi:MAG: hypothetical protein LBH98_06555 [Chitinispirillales bacterium]|jgi:hypothetical protein|nr:hypothetical protein [Chitinispirillales bacterium]